MSARATRITLVNNTSVRLTLIGVADPCGGSWTEGWRPPTSIEPNSHGPLVNSWRSESSGIATGTEGWVKYVIENQELVYIYWDNPFVWSNSTKAIDFKVRTSDITPDCGQDNQGGSEFPPVTGGCPLTNFFRLGRLKTERLMTG